MTRFVLSTLALTMVYLLVLTSVAPGDVLVGAVLSAAVAAAATFARPTARIGPPLTRRLVAAPMFALGTLADMVRGNWHVALYVLGGRGLESRGIVAIPRGTRSSSGVAAWGYITAISPDEIVVEADAERDILLVHLLDARDVPAIRARHERTYERRQRRVFPWSAMRAIFVGVALTWMTLLLVGGGLMLLRSRDMLKRIIVSDLLASIVIALLALLSYWRHTSYYLDAALALALLSFVSTLAAARHYAEGGPF